MTRHSKNNTACAFFTYAERSKLTCYGTQTQRIGKDSLRPTTSCVVCLQIARDPVLCPKGHLFCRECILTSLLTQKQKIRKQQEEVEETKRLENLEERMAIEKINKRKMEDFEALNSGPTGHHHYYNKKLKEDNEAAKEKNTAFWIPEKAPESTKNIVNNKNSSSGSVTFCPASKHTLTMKQLSPVIWKMNKEGKEVICESCLKNANIVKALVLLKKCSHVICTNCLPSIKNTDSIDTSSSSSSSAVIYSCHNCGVDNDVIINFSSEGTSFASSGSQIEIKKYEPSLI